MQQKSANYDHIIQKLELENEIIDYEIEVLKERKKRNEKYLWEVSEKNDH